MIEPPVKKDFNEDLQLLTEMIQEYKQAKRTQGIYSPERSLKYEQKNASTAATAAAKEDKPDLVKKIGKTTYRVKIHFNPTASSLGHI
jgi:hypothetical protein